MSTDNPTFIGGLQASADLSSYQYYLVERYGTTANQVSVCDAVTDRPIGVLYNKPSAAGDGADVVPFPNGGRVKVKVGSAGVAAGAVVSTDASGLLVATVTAGHFAIGWVDAAYNSGDLATVFCWPHVVA